MLLICPKCGETLDASPDISGAAECPYCGEELEIDVLRDSICPICGCAFEETDTMHICPSCKTPHHEECWTENQGCSTYGCASAAHLETHTPGGSNTGMGGDASMIPCPACGEMHPATDLVCIACGKLLGDDLSTDNGTTGISHWSQLTHDFQLLGRDLANVFRSWLGK